MNKIEKQIESIIFYKGEEVSFAELLKLVKISKEELLSVIQNIKYRHAGSGITIVTTDNSVLMTTSDDVSDIIEELEKEEYEKDLSKAALETLTIILYRGPIRRSMIDLIRGVNSQFTLRNLLIRGLIEKIPDPKDERTFLYKPTIDLLRFMNLGENKDLQEYKEINDRIEMFIKNSKNTEDGQ
jgi:segregation and condensation protein B